LLRYGFTNIFFPLGYPQTIILLLSASIVSEITYVCCYAWLSKIGILSSIPVLDLHEKIKATHGKHRTFCCVCPIQNCLWELPNQSLILRLLSCAFISSASVGC
jgi:hypothetical protein